MNNIYIIAAKRTPIGSLLGNLSSKSAIQLAVLCNNELFSNIIINRTKITKTIYGNVLSSGLGQNISRQIAINSGLSEECICKTINRVCGSSMEAIFEGIRSIKLGEDDLVLVGGTESMSNAPFINNDIRKGKKYGDINFRDSLLCDGLIDSFNKIHMGEIAENISKKYDVSKKELDDYALLSYKRSRNAYKLNKFNNELVNIEITDRRNKIIIKEDEEVNKILDTSKIYNLKSSFQEKGVITAGNASKLSDGACSILLANKKILDEYKIEPLCEIIDYNSFSQSPLNFMVSPVFSINNILKNNNLSTYNIDLYEINEAFATVPIIASKELKIDVDKININGGAISLGHPIGCSGARIVVTLINNLYDTKKNIGCASICIGGGGAASILIKTSYKK